MAEIDWVEVESSNIAAIGYDADEEDDLYVRFNSGAEYVYHDVPEDVYNSFMDSDSKGKYLNEHIKGVYQFEKA